MCNLLTTQPVSIGKKKRSTETTTGLSCCPSDLCTSQCMKNFLFLVYRLVLPLEHVPGLDQLEYTVEIVPIGVILSDLANMNTHTHIHIDTLTH